MRSLLTLAIFLCGVDHSHGGTTVPVLGRTRVGKGRFISEAVRLCTDQVINISSDRLVSHTKTAQLYNACSFNLMDTVGYDDSEGGTDANMIQLLGELEKDDFYPPLLIFKTLGESDLKWLKLFEEVFPQYVVAVRGPEEDFRSAVEDLGSFHPTKIFHLHEYLEKYPVTKDPYSDNVQSILDYYRNHLEPGREINFDAKMFRGDTKRVVVSSETREEHRNIEERFEVTETKRFAIKKKIRLQDGVWCGYFLIFWKCYPNYREEFVDDWEWRDIQVPHKRVIEHVDTMAREEVELWRILVDGNEFFVGEESRPWEVMDSREVSNKVVKM